MRHSLLLLSSVTTCLAAGTPIGGVNLIGEGFEGPFPYGSDEMNAAIAAAHSVGCKWVCLSFPAQYTASINSTGPFYAVSGGTPSGAPFRNASTPTEAGIESSIQAIHALGMKVIIRPMLDPDWRLPVNNPDAIYRGDIGKYFNDTQWAAWFVSYESLLAPWVAMAQRLGVEGVCIGAELSSTESQPAAWRRIASAVRANYTVPGGLVYYSSVFSPSSFPWDVSDVIGIDVYPRLALANPDPVAATVSQLVQAWEPTLQALAAMSTANSGKRVLLAETGICSINMPGVYLTPGYFECYSWPANQDVQAKYYESVFQTAWAQPWSAGVLFWKWALQGGPADQTFFPLNKTAANVMAEYF